MRTRRMNTSNKNQQLLHTRCTTDSGSFPLQHVQCFLLHHCQTYLFTKCEYDVSKFTFFSLKLLATTYKLLAATYKLLATTYKLLATTYKLSTKHNFVLPISLIRATGPTHYVTTVKDVQYELRNVSLGQGPVNFLRPFCAGTDVSMRQYLSLSLTHTHTQIVSAN
jgi:hypothetical protein